MTKLDEVIIHNTKTIREALTTIDKGAMKIAIVIDNSKKVIGTLTDGDIRRGLLNGLNLDSSIDNLYFKTPTLGHINESRESIIQKAISKKLYQIPIINDNGELIDIEDLGTLLKNTVRKNKIVLMAGGLGTRLRPLTSNTPKPLLEVGNKPILATIIENFIKYGFVNIIISVNYKAKMIKDYFGDGSKYGINIEYIEEDKRLGTAGALSLLKNKPKELFFVMNADLLTNVNFIHLLDYHCMEDAVATMCVRDYNYQVPYGVIQTKENKILTIEEKPIHKFFVNAGIYTLSPQVLDIIPENEYFDMPTLFEKLIELNKKVISFPIHEYWLDIGRIEEFEKANNEYHEVF